MIVDVATKEDLQLFRIQLLDDIKKHLSTEKHERKLGSWLRSKDVRKMLNISAGTLQNLRITGKLKSTKIGNLYYYNGEDIEKLLDSGM